MEAIIVTGAGTGLGKQLALLLSKQDYHVTIRGKCDCTSARPSKSGGDQGNSVIDNLEKTEIIIESKKS